MDTSLDNVAAAINKSLAAMSELKPYMTKKYRLMFVNTFLASKLRYGIQFYVRERQTMKNRYHQLKMKIATWTKNSYCYKISIAKICKSLNWEEPKQEILKETAKFFHNCMTKEDESN